MTNNKVIDVCPKCGNEGSMIAVSDMLFSLGQPAKWRHFARCEICQYETKAKA